MRKILIQLLTSVCMTAAAIGGGDGEKPIEVYKRLTTDTRLILEDHLRCFREYKHAAERGEIETRKVPGPSGVTSEQTYELHNSDLLYSSLHAFSFVPSLVKDGLETVKAIPDQEVFMTYSVREKGVPVSMDYRQEDVQSLKERLMLELSVAYKAIKESSCHEVKLITIRQEQDLKSKVQDLVGVLSSIESFATDGVAVHLPQEEAKVAQY